MQYIIIGMSGSVSQSEVFESNEIVSKAAIAAVYESKGWSNIVVFGPNEQSGLMASIGKLHEFVIPTSLVDAGESDKQIAYQLQKSNFVLSLMFDGHTDYLSQPERSSQLNVDFFDGEVGVYLYANCNQEEPTHIVNLSEARVERQQVAKEA
jgi:hypothetical protein